MNFEHHHILRYNLHAIWILGSVILVPAIQGCTAQETKPETSPFSSARWITAESTWKQKLAHAEQLLRRNQHITPRVLQKTADELLLERSASIRGEGPPMTPQINRRVTALIARLEAARRSAEMHGKERLEVMGAKAHPIQLKWPIEAASLSSGFGTRRDPFDPTRQTFHDGIDLVAPMGTRVHSPESGIVVSSGLQKDGCGLGVSIDHAEGFMSRFCHLSRVDVHRGDRVVVGQLIGRLGRSGRTTGPHLHWSLRQNGVALDPVPLILRTQDKLR